MTSLKTLTPLAILLLVGLFACQSETVEGPRFRIELPATASDTTFDGRLILMLSTNNEAEPRFQISDGLNTQLAFGMDVDDWATGQSLDFASDAFGYPIESLQNVPAGKYYVQALLHKYETFNRADGHTVKMPMDRGEGQQWNQAPGNLYSKPQLIDFDPAASNSFSVSLDQEIAPIPEPEDNEYVKHIKIRSKLLSDFWGRDMYLGAHVLLPQGWADHPDVKYPLAVFHGHFPADFGGWRTTPPDTSEPCVFSARFGLDCYNHIEQQEAYDFYKMWTGPDFPRVLAIEIQHANPFYDDSYAVNSENIGPYGDAITYELIPYIEAQFRGIGEGWARFTYGGSTGGWEALAVQVKYPEEYNGCYAACPDPIDFRAYCLINIYEHKNAYYLDSEFKHNERPGHRDSLGFVDATVKDMNYRELVLGDKSRSGGQFDIWEAVYSPVGPDGYPQRIFDKRTGAIDPKVAEYWRENYDLAYIMKRDWSKIGKSLQGKVHIYCGDMDNYYLNNAVYLTEAMLKSTSAPYYDGEVDYGDRAEHCWNGDHSQPNAISRLRYHRMFIPKWTAMVRERAPQGADVTAWLY